MLQSEHLSALTALHRTVSPSASFILLLFIYWNLHVSDGQNRSRFFSGSNACPPLFPIFLLLPILLLPFTTSSPTQPQQRHNRTSNILLKATGGSKRIPDDQPTPRMPLSREQVLALLSRLPQRRYRIALPILPNTCGATSDPSNSCAFRSLN